MLELKPEGNGPRARFCRAIGNAAAARLQALCHGGWRELGPAQSPRVTIRNLGSGSYVIANGMVLLSTSDGSDPRSNGLSYWLWIPWPWSARLLALLLLGIGYLLARPGRLAVDIRSIATSPVVTATVIIVAVCLFGGLDGDATAKTLSIGAIVLAGLYALPRSQLRGRRAAALLFVAGFVLTELTAWSIVALFDFTEDSWGARQVSFGIDSGGGCTTFGCGRSASLRGNVNGSFALGLTSPNNTFATCCKILACFCSRCCTGWFPDCRGRKCSWRR